MIKLINPSVELIKESNPLRKLELCGRVCYKSEEKISEGSAERLIRSIIKRGHTSVLEHFWIVMKSEDYINKVDADWLNISQSTGVVLDNWLRFENEVNDHRRYINYLYRYDKDEIIGNVRAWRFYLQHHPALLSQFQFRFPVLFDDLEHHSGTPDFKSAVELSEFDEYSSVRMVVDRGCCYEIIRHRIFSFSQESTRYCNYDGAMQFIIPIPFEWANDLYNGIDENGILANECKITDFDAVDWLESCIFLYERYAQMIGRGRTPQEARSILPNSLKTEVIMTAPNCFWDTFFHLRCDAAAHPQMRLVADLTKKLICS